MGNERDHIVFQLYEAVIALYPASANGAIAGAPVWWGTVANDLTLTDELEGVLMAASGDLYATNHQVDEHHRIEIGKTWVLLKSGISEFVLTKNATYLLQIVWSEGPYWFQRNYYGVTVDSARQSSFRALQSITNLVFQAQRVVPNGGTSGIPVYTPQPPSDEVTDVPFFHEEVFVPGDYFLGQYKWQQNVTLVGANAFCSAPQNTPVVLGLEIGGVLSSYTLTLPVGTANTEVTASVSLAGVVIPGGQSVRWKVVSGPSDGASAAWQGCVVMQVT